MRHLEETRRSPLLFFFDPTVSEVYIIDVSYLAKGNHFTSNVFKCTQGDYNLNPLME